MQYVLYDLTMQPEFVTVIGMATATAALIMYLWLIASKPEE